MTTKRDARAFVALEARRWGAVCAARLGMAKQLDAAPKPNEDRRTQAGVRLQTKSFDLLTPAARERAMALVEHLDVARVLRRLPRTRDGQVSTGNEGIVLLAQLEAVAPPKPPNALWLAWKTGKKTHELGVGAYSETNFPHRWHAHPALFDGRLDEPAADIGPAATLALLDAGRIEAAYGAHRVSIGPLVLALADGRVTEAFPPWTWPSEHKFSEAGRVAVEWRDHVRWLLVRGAPWKFADAINAEITRRNLGRKVQKTNEALRVDALPRQVVTSRACLMLTKRDGTPHLYLDRTSVFDRLPEVHWVRDEVAEVARLGLEVPKTPLKKARKPRLSGHAKKISALLSAGRETQAIELFRSVGDPDTYAQLLSGVAVDPLDLGDMLRADHFGDKGQPPLTRLLEIVDSAPAETFPGDPRPALAEVASLALFGDTHEQTFSLDALRSLPALRGLQTQSLMLQPASAPLPLEWLAVWSNWVRDDFAFLRSFPKLKHLFVSDAALTSLRHLSACPELRSVRIHRASQLTSFGGLELAHLERLECTPTKLAAFDFGALPSLRSLRLYPGAGATDRRPLGQLRSLEALDLGTKQASDYSFLYDLPNLTRLQIGARASSVVGLPTLSNIEVLGLHGPVDVPLRDLPALRSLDLSTSKELPNLERALSQLPADNQIHSLWLDDTHQLTDLRGLEALPQLARISLQRCGQLADFSALLDHPNPALEIHTTTHKSKLPKALRARVRVQTLARPSYAIGHHPMICPNPRLR